MPTHTGWPYAYTWQYFVWVLCGTSAYLFVSFRLITAINSHFSAYEYNTHSEEVENLYFRVLYNTEYFSASKFLTYCVMNLLGFTFVQCVTLKYERKSPILDQHFSKASFIKTILFVNPAIFLISLNMNLRGKNDLDGYCGSGAVATPKVEALKLENMRDPMM